MKKYDRMDDQLQSFYLDYFNNYLTVARIAEDNGLSEEHTLALIDMGRIIHTIRTEAWSAFQRHFNNTTKGQS